MDAVNIVINDDYVIFHSSSLEKAREAGARIVQWVPVSSSLLTEIVMPDASVLSGFAESDCRQIKVDDVIQFERVGFARLDKVEDGKLSFYYAHK